MKEVQSDNHSFGKVFEDASSLFWKNLIESYKKIVPEIETHLKAELNKVFSGFIDYSSEEIQKLYCTLSEHGWFIPGEIYLSVVTELNDQISAGDFESLDRLMCNWVIDSMPLAETNLTNNHPHRESIFSAALAAHNQRKFELSTPVFLIQAEGICIDLINVKLFSKDKYGEPKTKKELVQKVGLNKYMSAILHPLLNGTSVNANETTSKNYPNSLNRHEILHGINVTYPLEINSLKALSLVCYLVNIVARELKMR